MMCSTYLICTVTISSHNELICIEIRYFFLQIQIDMLPVLDKVLYIFVFEKLSWKS